MGLLSFFQRKSSATPESSSGSAPVSIQAARTRARRRLIGAVVLLGVGVIGFPLLFESQPRPIPVDIPIDIPARDNAAALKPPAAQPSAAAATAARKPAPQAPAVIDEGPIEVEVPASTPTRSPSASAKPASAPVAKPAAAPAAATSASRPTAEPMPINADAARFVVQVGAFAEADKARDARTKVEGLGLKTYTQVVDTPAGKRTRVRVGPYASRDEADKAAARIRGGGLPAAILEL